MYHAVVISTLLYGCESWTPYRRHINQLEAFHIRCLQRILGITWRDKIPFTEVLLRAGIHSIESMILRRLLRWIGHVIRMPENRLPKMALFGEFETGSRPRGGPKRRFRDHIQRALIKCDIDPAVLESLARDKSNWRTRCNRGV